MVDRERFDHAQPGYELDGLVQRRHTRHWQLSGNTNGRTVPLILWTYSRR